MKFLCIVAFPRCHAPCSGESRPGYTAGGQQPATNPDLRRAAIGETRNTWAGGTQELKGGHQPTEGRESSGREDDAEDRDPAQIERLWRDVFENVIDLFYTTFHRLEAEGWLNPDKETDLQGSSLVRGFRGGAPGRPRPRGPRLAPVGPPRGHSRPTFAVLAAV
ncbi:unnamed protein product [Gadus morhua 'NCC']